MNLKHCYCYKKWSIDKKISYICQNEYSYFLNKYNVVGVARGYKITNGFCTNEICIKVFVSNKLPYNQLRANDLVPNLYKSIKTDVVETGMFYTQSLTNRIRPVLGGYSIGNVVPSITSGTLGCLVKDSRNNYYILSNNHILANSNDAPLGTRTIQPSTSSGGKLETDIIALLDKFIVLKETRGGVQPENFVDCAMSKVISKSVVSSKIAFVGVPQGVIIPRLGEDVRKVGKTTELTTGKITDVDATVEVLTFGTYKLYLYKKQIVTTKMSEEGDSGSVLLDKNNYAIGLAISGSTNRSIFNRMDLVLSMLNVSVVTE